MSFLSTLFGGGPPKPRLYESDEVQPLHVFDNIEVLAGYDLFWTFSFEEVLDAEILGRALAELIETGEWRRLGGRYRRNAAGRMEIHIPTPFTASRPPVYFTKEHFDQDKAEHPVASQIPVAGKTAELLPESRIVVPLAYGPGAPRNIQDRLAGDFPQIGLHVVTFRNGTLVSFTWNHITCDLGGFSAILKGFVARLHGQPVPDFMSKEDGLRHVYTDPPEDVKLIIGDKILSGWRKAVWVAHFLWDQFWTTRGLIARQVCIPKQQFERLLEKCRAEAAEQAKALGCDSFISEGDVLMALATRAGALCLPQGSRRSVSSLCAVDVRGRFPEAYRNDEAYVQNMSIGMFVIKPASEIVQASIGSLALSVRGSLEAQLAQPQMRKITAIAVDTVLATGNLPVLGDSTSYLATFSNWTKANLLEKMDLGPAVVSAKRQTRNMSTQRAALPVSLHSRSVEPGMFSPSVVVARGKDHNGDVWLEADCSPAALHDMVDHINAA